MSVAQVLPQIIRDQIFYEASGGGVTFSGGEPLAQPEFLLALLSACRARGVHTAVDTCGLVSLDILRAIAPHTDLFLYDLKMMDAAKHQHYTGASNQLILQNLTALGHLHARLWLRMPILPGINDAPADLTAAAEFAATVAGVQQINLLPFHRTGLHKSEQLGKSTPTLDILAPADEKLAEAAAIFQACGLKTTVGG